MTTLRERLHAPGPLFWAMLSLPDPTVATILGHSGVDFVMLDAEPKTISKLPGYTGPTLDIGSFTPSSAGPCLQALKRTPASTCVRTASAGEAEIRGFVEAGLDSVQVPKVGTAEEAASVVGFAHAANPEVAVITMIETQRGVANVSEIAAVPGVDAIMIGPGDLSSDYGLPGRWEHPTVIEAIDAVVAATLAAGLKIFAPRYAQPEVVRESMLVNTFHDALGLVHAASDAAARKRSST